MRPAEIISRQPALLVSAGYLAQAGARACPDADPAALYLASACGEGKAVAGAVRLGGEVPLPSMRAVAACAGDAVAHARLRATGVTRWGTLPDAGRPAALWRLAERLGLVEWWMEAPTPAALAQTLGALAGLVGAADMDAAGPCRAALEVAAALEDGGHGGGPAALIEAARASGLWPRPTLGVGGVPHALGAAEAGRLRARPGAAAVFALAASALAAAMPDGLLSTPPARPLLLGPMPPSGDEGEVRRLDGPVASRSRCRCCRRPTPLRWRATWWVSSPGWRTRSAPWSVRWRCAAWATVDAGCHRCSCWGRPASARPGSAGCSRRPAASRGAGSRSPTVPR